MMCTTFTFEEGEIMARVLEGRRTADLAGRDEVVVFLIGMRFQPAVAGLALGAGAGGQCRG